MPAGRNRPLQAANRDFLEQSAKFLQISPTAQKADGVAAMVCLLPSG